MWKNAPVPGVSLPPGIAFSERMIVAVPLLSLGHFKHIEGRRSDYSIRRCEPAESPLETVVSPSADNSRETPELSW